MADRRPTRAMVLAAGLGVRLRPVTLTLPKPLVRVAGRPLIDGVLDRLAEAGVEEAVVNTHHLGTLLEQHLSLRQRPRVRFSPEAALLETGGGVANALAHLGPRPFYVVNGDVLWRDGGTPALLRLAQAWDEQEMDALLLLHPTATAIGYHGHGDFVMDQEGRLRRRREAEVVPFLFAGIQILHPRLFEAAPAGSFSLNRLYDAAISAGRLRGLRHDGEWYHVGTPQELKAVEAALAEGSESLTGE